MVALPVVANTGPLVAAGLQTPVSVSAGQAALSAAAGSATTAELGSAAAGVATEIASGAASHIAQRGTLVAVMELGADATATRAAAQGIAGAERAVEIAKAGAIQQEIRAGIAESKAVVEKVSELLKRLAR